MNTRLQAALVAMLAGIAALIIATAAMHRAPHNAPVKPASDTGQLQPVESSTATSNSDQTEVVNTVDPPAAHDSDMPTGDPVTTTPPSPPAPAPAEEPEHPLVTITENGTTAVPKPETQAPVTSTNPTRPCGIEIAGNPSCP